MPTYEYACKDCGERLEVVQSFHDDPLTECPTCAGRLRKVFSAAGIIFKGSGWHIKDYAGSSATNGQGDGTRSDRAGSERDPERASSERDSERASSGTGSDRGSGTGRTTAGKSATTGSASSGDARD